MIHALSTVALAFLVAPLLPGVINRTKALIAGRRGAPLLQGYSDLVKLLRKGAVYSRTTSFVFRAAPAIGLAAVALAVAIVPFGGAPAALSFPGDILLFAGLLALSRFVIVLAALDTGSSFEGMGASREVQIAVFAEPALVLTLVALARLTGESSLNGVLRLSSPAGWNAAGPALILVLTALAILYLAENCRIPVDDPNTHLELTMIHEVMVLDHGGPDLALILYGASLKLWALGALMIGIALPWRTGSLLLDTVGAVAGMIVLAGLVGVAESIMARLRMTRIPFLLAGAGACSLLAFLIVLR